MLYSKAENKKYTEMAMEFDKEFYTSYRDDNKLFKYMYLIFYMLACKGDFFTKFEDFDKYAQYAAKIVYTRYIKNEKKGKKFKSVLNYCKGCKNHLKIDYQNEAFIQVTKAGDENVKAFEQSYRSSIRDSYNREDLMLDMEELLNIVPTTINKIIKETPYSKDRLMCKRLYMSCLLTFLSGITLPNQVITSINKKKDFKDNLVIKQYQKNMEESLVLWGLDDEMSDYVLMLVNKLRSTMSSEINELSASYSIPEDVVDSIIASAYEEKNYTNYDESMYK